MTETRAHQPFGSCADVSPLGEEEERRWWLGTQIPAPSSFSPQGCRLCLLLWPVLARGATGGQFGQGCIFQLMSTACLPPTLYDKLYTSNRAEVVILLLLSGKVPVGFWALSTATPADSQQDSFKQLNLDQCLASPAVSFPCDGLCLDTSTPDLPVSLLCSCVQQWWDLVSPGTLAHSIWFRWMFVFSFWPPICGQ